MRDQKKEAAPDMAIQLSTKTSENIKDQVKKERNFAFLAVRILIGVVTAGYAIFSLVNGFSAYQEAMANDERYGQLEREYAQLKSEVDAWHEENDHKPDAMDDESGAHIEYRDMYSAMNDGIEVASLQNIYYRDKELLQADRQRLNALTRSTECWLGAGWDPAKTPIRWEFSTFYDATDKTYDVMWQCWHEAPSGTMYLIAIRFATYDGETGSFRMVNGMYQTDFCRMLESKGAVEAGEPRQMADTQAVRDMVDGIMDNGGTGSIPEDDPGQSAGVIGDIANGPVGGGEQ